MRRILFGAVIFLGLLSTASPGTANAADLGMKAPAAPVPWVCPWCSVYVGFNAGYGTTSGSGVNNTGTDTGAGGLGTALASGALPITVDSNVTGFVGGGQIGVNFEPIRDWIVGAEVDFDGMGVKNALTPTPGSIPTTAGVANTGVPMTATFDREVDWVSTFRLKGGFSVMNNALFVYGTAGGAVAQFGISDQFICSACTPNPASQPGTSSSTKTTRVGGAIGAGLEWMVIPKISVKAELLYIEVGSSTNTITYNYGGNTSTLTSTARDGLTMFRGGLNWYF